MRKHNATCGGPWNDIGEDAQPTQHLGIVRKLPSYTQIFVALGYFLSDVPRIVSSIVITIDFAALQRKLMIFLDGFQWQALAVDILLVSFQARRDFQWCA